MTRSRALGLFRLFRLELPVAAGVCALLGQLLAAGALPPLSRMVLSFVSIFCLSATALILNDYFDRETDRINAPQRPIPAGMVSPADALVLSIVVALLGLASAALLSPAALAAAAAVWVLGVAYNWRLKRAGLAGNLLVALSVGMTFVFGGIAVGHIGDRLVIWFGALAMLFDLGEEIAADAMDVEGDRRTGSRSLAVVLGPRRALGIAAGIFGAVVLVSMIPFAFGWLAPVYLIPIALMDTILVVATVRLLDPRARHPRRLIRIIYLGGSFSILLFVVLRLALSAGP